LHIRALDWLSTSRKRGTGGLEGPRPSITYIQRLSPFHEDIIFQYAKDLLQSDPEESLNIFIDPMYQPLRDPEGVTSPAFNSPAGIDKKKIIAFLESIGPELTQRYLEFILIVQKDSSLEFANNLIRICIKQAEHLTDPAEPRRARLQEYLANNIVHYKAEQIIHLLPDGTLI